MKSAYGKEPFDLKLTVLRLMRQLPQMCLWMVVGIVVLFGAYCAKNYIFCPPKTYSGVSTFRVEYSDKKWSENFSYINYATWNTYLSSDEFQGILEKYMDSELSSLSAQVRKDAYKVDVPSDLRVIVVTAKSENKELTAKLSKAMEDALTAEFPGFCSDVSEMRLIDPALVSETHRDIRPVRAFVLSLVVSIVFVVLIYAIKELGCDDIHLPGVFSSRFGVKSLGADCDSAFESNVAAVFADKKVAILPVSENNDVTALKEKVEKALGEGANAVAYPAPTLSPEALNELKEEAVLLAVPYEKGNSGKLAFVLELLDVRDVKPAAAVLTDADEWLLDMYYGKNR